MNKGLLKMINLMGGNFCSVILVAALGCVTASAYTIYDAPTVDVTLTSWQLDLTTGQESFSFSGPGISLTGSGFYEEPIAPITGYSNVPNARQDVPLNMIFTTLDTARAQGIVSGVTYGAANPLGLYGASAGVLIPPFSLPQGANPVVTLSTTTPPGGGRLYACTPGCDASSADIDIPFILSFLPGDNTTQLQFQSLPSVPGQIDDVLESFSVTASPTPEPGSYAIVALGLCLLGVGARTLRKRV